MGQFGFSYHLFIVILTRMLRWLWKHHNKAIRGPKWPAAALTASRRHWQTTSHCKCCCVVTKSSYNTFCAARVTSSSQEINWLNSVENFFIKRSRSPRLIQPARREHEHPANQTIVSGRECELLFWITTSHYLDMTHPRCYSTSKGPLQLMWRPGRTTGETFL